MSTRPRRVPRTAPSTIEQTTSVENLTASSFNMYIDSQPINGTYGNTTWDTNNQLIINTLSSNNIYFGTVPGNYIPPGSNFLIGNFTALNRGNDYDTWDNTYLDFYNHGPPNQMLSVGGDAVIEGTVTTGNILQIGTNTNDSVSKTIYFGGLYGDNAYDHCVIENRIYGTGTNEKRELLLFSGNDAGDPDRIRLRAGQICFDTYTGFTVDRNTESIKMVINSDGNVGIGTTIPGAKIDVVGTLSARFEGEVQFLKVGGYTSHANYGVNRDWYIRSGNNNGKVIINDIGGNVGIGHGDPSQKLTVAGTTLSSQFYTNGGQYQSAAGVGGNLRGMTIDNTNINYGSGAEIALQTGSNWAWIIRQSAQSFGNLLRFYGTRGDGIFDEILQLRNNNGVPRVGINQSGPSYTLDVNGSLYYFAGGYQGSDDRIKYNEEDIPNALSIINKLKPQKYEKIFEIPKTQGTWIPTDEEWENVKSEYKYGDEFGFIAQDVRNIPELSFLVHGEESRTDIKTLSIEEYSNLTTEEQVTYTISYTHYSNTITQEEYSILIPEEQEKIDIKYNKQIETETPIALNYQGLFVVAIGAIQELKVKNDILETQIADLLARVTALES